MRILGVIFDARGDGRNAYVIDDGSERIQIPGEPEYSEYLTEYGVQTYPGPSAGSVAAWLTRFAAAELGGKKFEFETPPPSSEEVHY